MEFQHSKKVPYLSEYLAYEVAKSEANRGKPWNSPLPWLTVGGLVGAFLLPLPGIATFGLVVVLLGVLSKLLQKLSKPRNPEQERRDEVLRPYLKLAEYRRLHRNIDSTALQLLEASAYYWSKLRIRLNSAAWNSHSTPLHLSAIRAQTLEAIDHAMEEQIELCLKCVIPIGTKPKTDLREIMEDVIGLDVDDVLDSLKKGLKVKSGTQSGRIHEIFEPSRAIAEKLKMLSEELDQISTENAIGVSTQSGSRLDSALRDLQDVKTAYVELDQS